MARIVERHIKWHPRTLKICQIPKEGLEYAFLSEDYVQIHQFVWCKDFMQDVVHASVNGQRVEIYGFSYNPKTDPPLYKEKTRLLLNSYRDTNFGSKVLGGLRDFLHQIEKQLKMELTIFEKAANPHHHYRQSGVYIVEGDKRWMNSPPMISLYTLLLRVGMVHTKGHPFARTIEKVKNGDLLGYYAKIRTDNDRSVLKTIESGLSRILRHGDREIFHQEIQKNYPAKTASGHSISVFTVHDSFGMVGFSQNGTEDNFPHWHRFKE